jgi:hypothetical protein
VSKIWKTRKKEEGIQESIEQGAKSKRKNVKSPEG